MTQADIDAMEHIKKEINQVENRYYVEINHLRSELAIIAAKCDHKYPDGSSAIVYKYAMFCISCSICHWSDL